MVFCSRRSSTELQFAGPPCRPAREKGGRRWQEEMYLLQRSDMFMKKESIGQTLMENPWLFPFASTPKAVGGGGNQGENDAQGSGPRADVGSASIPAALLQPCSAGPTSHRRVVAMGQSPFWFHTISFGHAKTTPTHSEVFPDLLEE